MRIKYTNMKKDFPNMGTGAFDRWLAIKRYWSGRLIIVSIKHHVFDFDFRKGWLKDVMEQSEK